MVPVQNLFFGFLSTLGCATSDPFNYSHRPVALTFTRSSEQQQLHTYKFKILGQRQLLLTVNETWLCSPAPPTELYRVKKCMATLEAVKGSDLCKYYPMQCEWQPGKSQSQSPSHTDTHTVIHFSTSPWKNVLVSYRDIKKNNDV